MLAGGVYGRKNGMANIMILSLLFSFSLVMQENTSYWFTMVCTDRDNGLHASSSIQFTTGTVHSTDRDNGLHTSSSIQFTTGTV